MPFDPACGCGCGDSLVPLLLLLPAHVRPMPGFTDPVSSLSHLIGAVTFAGLAVPLVRRGGSWSRSLALGVFAFAVVLMFSMSGTFHLLPRETTGRSVLQRLDHASIFVLIAASFTPPHLMLFRGWLRWGVIAFVWSFAATAIPLKMVYFDTMSEALGLSLYLGFGWVGFVSGFAVWHRYGMRFTRPLFLGGIAYTAGALFDFARAPNPIPGVLHAHELFHFCIIAGVAFHWQFCERATRVELKPPMDAHEAYDELEHAVDELLHLVLPPGPHVRGRQAAVRPYVQGPIDLPDFLAEVFDATVLERHDMGPASAHLHLRIGDGVVVVEAGDLPERVEPWTSTVYVYVADADAVFARALERGATALSAPEDKPHGERQGAVEDPAGNTWYIASMIGD